METEFRPSFSTLRRTIRGVIPAIVILGFIDYFRLQQPLPVYLAEWLGGLALLSLYFWLYFRNTRITAALHSLTIRNAFGISHTVADHHLVNAVMVDSFVQSSPYSSTNQARLFILDEEGRAVLRWGGQTWTPDEMQSLTTTLDLPVTAVRDRMNARKFRALYPKALNPLEAHPVIFGLAIAAIIAAVVVALVVNES